MSELLRKCLPLPNQAQVELEMYEIEKLIPVPGLSPEDRRVYNDRIRNLLSTTSNETLLMLYRNHPLSQTELVGRLQRHAPFAPESLAEVVAYGVDMPNSLPKGQKRIYGLALQNMVELLLVIGPERALDTIARTFPITGRPNGAVIEYLLRIRPDAISIGEQLTDRMGDDEFVLAAIRRNLVTEMDPKSREYVDFFLRIR